MRHAFPLVAAATLLLMSPPLLAAEQIVLQKGKAFSRKNLVVQQGDTVRFVNEDPFAHNVFSLSDTKSFDLGSHGQGTSKTVLMDKLGTVEVECAVHPDMQLTIEVKK